MQIQIKRAYEEPAASDGYRVLVDRLWLNQCRSLFRPGV